MECEHHVYMKWLSQHERIEAIEAEAWRLYQEWASRQQMDPTGEGAEGVSKLTMPLWTGRIARATNVMNWINHIKPRDIDVTGSIRFSEAYREWESHARNNNWPLALLLMGIVDGKGLKGEAEVLWNQRKDSGCEVLNAVQPTPNQVQDVLLMYLKVRYIMYMVVGKPISNHRMRSLIDTFKMTQKGARGMKMDMIKFLSYYMRKAGHTAEGWYQEMDLMASRSGPISVAYWLRYTTKYRSRREAEVMMGKQSKLTYEMIRYLIDLIYEEDLQLENMQIGNQYRPKHVHAIQTEEDEESRAAKQQQQQQYQDQMDQQSQISQLQMYSAQLQQQQQLQQQHPYQQQQPYQQQHVYTAHTAPAVQGGIYGPASDPPDQVVNGRTVWLVCGADGPGCGMLHPLPRGRNCLQRVLDENGTPHGRWAKYMGWNLEYLATLRPDIVTSILKRMPVVGERGIPPNLIEEVREEVRLIRVAAPPGAYRGSKGK